ncbi:hypothetical protein CAPTEDRAFT_218356 [Capitella teleta]|uniref:Uncharacterized protein n=1 Tax=Capitella teleta TaxID=283909 RepID=R7ULF3_CAPTE|nr:hypothetical protein CAPTEDRAFT_218356 [Capitella teleta]|eukprot:ELU06923.1 hypothetical protein CAPTEDRAFT_218356 [Capitella teleta]
MAEVKRLFDFSTTACVRLLLNHSPQTTQELSLHLISQLSSRQFVLVTDHLLRIIVQQYPRQLTNELLAALVPLDLRHLSLKGCVRISVTGMRDALASAKNLRVLDLRECSHFMNPTFFRCCAQAAPLISILNLESCPHVNDDCIKISTLSLLYLAGFSLNTVSSIQRHCNTLTEEQMEFLFLNKTDFTMTPRLNKPEEPHCVFTENFVSLSKSTAFKEESQELTNSNLNSSNWTLSDRWLQSYYPVLQKLNMNHLNTHFTHSNIHLKILLLANPQLERLEVGWPPINDDVLVYVSNCLPNLSHLSLEDCSLITNDGMSIVCSQCSRLRSLDLRGACYITTEGILPFLKRGNAQMLNLAETQIIDSTLHLLSLHCSQEIQSLDVSWCEDLDAEGLEEIAQNCVNLRTFNLRMCKTSETFVKNLVQNCRSLCHLDLAHTSILNDGHLVSIALRLRCLESLDISWNTDVTDVGVRCILCYCSKLKTLKLAGDKQLTSEPFLPIVPDWKAFFRMQAALVVRYNERQSHDSGGDSTDEEIDEVAVINRSTVYAPMLQFLDLEYVDCVQDDQLCHIVAVCRGTLVIKDYYSYDVEPKIFSKGPGCPILSNDFYSAICFVELLQKCLAPLKSIEIFNME